MNVLSKEMNVFDTNMHFGLCTTSPDHVSAICFSCRIKWHITNPLDPLLSDLMLFESNFDLETQIKEIFQFLDVDGRGILSAQEVMRGLRKLDVSPRIHLSEQEADRLMRGVDINDCRGGGNEDETGRHQFLKVPACP